MKAPFDGVLLTNAALAKIITDYERRIKFLETELVKFQKDCFARLDAHTKECAVRLKGEGNKLDSCQKVVTSCERNLLQSKPTPWYKTPYMNFIFGSLVTGTLCTGMAVGFNQ